MKSTESSHVYWTRKNKRTLVDNKLKLKKHDPNVRKHVLYKEVKK